MIGFNQVVLRDYALKFLFVQIFTWFLYDSLEKIVLLNTNCRSIGGKHHSTVYLI